MWLLGFEPRSPRPQRGILTTKLQPQLNFLTSQNKLINQAIGIPVTLPTHSVILQPQKQRFSLGRKGFRDGNCAGKFAQICPSKSARYE